MDKLDKKAIEEYRTIVDDVGTGRRSVGICNILLAHTETGENELLKVIVSKGELAHRLQMIVYDLLRGREIHIDPSPWADADDREDVESTSISEEVKKTCLH
jgi:hypothetical protein